MSEDGGITRLSIGFNKIAAVIKVALLYGSVEINSQETLVFICLQKKSTLHLTAFMRYCKNIANLLF